MATPFLTLDDLSVQGKTVLVRCDLNVPMENGQVTDTTRIDRTAPTLKELAAAGARVVVLSHLGRPKGKADPSLSQRPLADALSRALDGKPVAFAEECVGPPAREAVDRLGNGDVLLLENVRFHAEEEKNDEGFARQLAELGEVYVNDAFSTAHRAHSSTEAIARLLPQVAAGRLMQEELDALTSALEAPRRPVVAVVGGAKVSTKLSVLENLVEKVDSLVLGGGMANTFLLARDIGIGASLAEREMIAEASRIMEKAQKGGCEIVLPVDAIIAPKLARDVSTRMVSITAVPEDMMILDIGMESVRVVQDRLGRSATVLWNGPLGAFETPPFDQGTNLVARGAADLTKAGDILSVAGGGDTVAALHRADVLDDFTYVSSAGGAFLEWLEGKELPGVTVLRKG